MRDRQVTVSSTARALARQRASAAARAYPLYWRMLRLRHVRPNGWQRAVLVEGVTAVAVTLVLADVASAWTLVVLPVAAAAIVKGHDVIAGWLPSGRTVEALPPPRLADYTPVVGILVALLLIWLL
ncbi:MAG TPA: hypothetical protein VFJ17_00520 [Mycobacteriales bacterium]|jgi:hypothetical protein|nr:hypothetical protein [Mycobacteriales bacterium]